MNKLECNKKQYIEEFDIYVEDYLTYAQIQNIINSVIKLDSWAEREQNIDMLILYFATNLTKEEIQEYSHEEWLKSGLIEIIKNNLKNYYQINEGIEYTESIRKTLSDIVKHMPELSKNSERSDKIDKIKK